MGDCWTWRTVYATIPAPSGLGDYSALNDLLELKVQEATEELHRNLQLDLHYGFESRHRPDRQDYAKIVSAQLWHERGERLLINLGGKATVAWRRKRDA